MCDLSYITSEMFQVLKGGVSKVKEARGYQFCEGICNNSVHRWSGITATLAEWMMTQPNLLCFTAIIYQLLSLFDQFVGLDHLDQGCRNQNLRSPMCAMVLLAYHSVITYYLGKHAIISNS